MLAVASLLLDAPNEVWVGVLLPLLIALVQQWHWPREVRALVGFAVCFAVAVVMNVAGFADIHSFTTSLVTLLALAATFYRNYWLPTGVAPKLEKATTFTDPGEHAKTHPDDGVGVQSSIQ